MFYLCLKELIIETVSYEVFSSRRSIFIVRVMTYDDDNIYLHKKSWSFRQSDIQKRYSKVIEVATPKNWIFFWIIIPILLVTLTFRFDAMSTKLFFHGQNVNQSISNLCLDWFINRILCNWCDKIVLPTLNI